jgi:hypothetical protein
VAGNFRIKGPQHHHAAIGERNSWSRDAPPGWPVGPMKFPPPGPRLEFRLYGGFAAGGSSKIYCGKKARVNAELQTSRATA